MARVARKPSSSSASSGRCPKPTKVTQKASSKSSTSSAKTVGVLYTRTSSDGKKLAGSIKRQTSAAKQAAQRDSTPLKVKLSEVVSGSLPYDQRAALKSLVERTHPAVLTRSRYFLSLPVPWRARRLLQSRSGRRAGSTMWKLCAVTYRICSLTALRRHSRSSGRCTAQLKSSTKTWWCITCPRAWLTR